MKADFIVERNGKKFVDVVRILPRNLSKGRKIIIKELNNDKIEIYVKKGPRGGHDSKKFIMNKFIKLDDLFFEGIGLWQGEGGKSKGLYFGNSCLELLLHFLRFVEEKLGLNRNEFKVTINSQTSDPEDKIKERWSKKLKIPFENFTRVCRDKRINQEYAQVYLNGIVLSKLMKTLHNKLKRVILQHKNFTVSYLRGIIAGEGQIALKKSGTISHVSVSSGDLIEVNWYKKCLNNLSISSGKYMKNGRKFPIYGRGNLEKMQSLKLLSLHLDKKMKFENGISKYQRYVMKGEKIQKLIMQQLNPKPKTYDEIANALNKGRSTIQSHYIPILEKKGFVKRIGKKGRALLFGITEKGAKFLNES